MKQLVVAALLLAVVQSTHAQNFDEWFRQKKTKIRRLVEQIAANQVYIEYAQKGYKIVSQGLHTIRDIKNGDFRLHLGFFDTLRVVNPRIRKWALVGDIIASQLQLVKMTRQALQSVRESGQLTASELDYCKKVFDNLLEELLHRIDELGMVITNGKVAMSDDERITRIRRIHTDVTDKVSFTASFSNEMALLAIQRLHEQAEIDYSKKISQ